MGNRLKTLRGAKDMRQMALAQASGVAQSTISAMERGLVDPKATTLQRLAKALGVSLDELTGGDE